MFTTKVIKALKKNSAEKTPLQYLMEKKVRKSVYVNSFEPAQAMQLVRLGGIGADPDQRKSEINTLLYLIVKYNYINHRNDYVDELVNTHNASIDSKGKHKKTPLQYLMDKKVRESVYVNSFEPERAMQLIRLGADPNTKNSKGKSLLYLLVKDNFINKRANNYIEELHRYIDQAEKKKVKDVPIQNSETSPLSASTSSLQPAQNLLSNLSVLSNHNNLENQENLLETPGTEIPLASP